MTARYHSLTVALAEDIRADDIVPLVNAIGQLRGVLSITSQEVDSTTFMAEERARHELGQKLLDVVYPKRKGNP